MEDPEYWDEAFGDGDPFIRRSEPTPEADTSEPGTQSADDAPDRGLRQDDHPQREKLSDLFPADGSINESEVLDRLKNMVDGKYGNLEVSVSEVNGHAGLLAMRADILYDGKKIGYIQEDLYRDDVKGDMIQLHIQHIEVTDKSARGGGFLNEYMAKKEALCRESGVPEIRLRANIDVGGYAWARQQFDFAYQDKAFREIGPRLRAEIGVAERQFAEMRQNFDSMSPGSERDVLGGKIEFMERELEYARDIKSRFVIGHANFPTPFEISELGRPRAMAPGESKGEQWMGKRILIGCGGWGAVKRL